MIKALLFGLHVRTPDVWKLLADTLRFSVFGGRWVRALAF